MSLRVIWTRQANVQLDAVYAYISQDNPGAAQEQLEVIGSAVANLAGFPELGRIGASRRNA